MAAASPTTPANVLIVTVDCLRRDRLSAYGYPRPTTPFLDALVDDALHATSAYSTSSWTTPAVASMLTGLYPHHHGAGAIEGDPADLDLHHLPTGVAPGVRGLPFHFSSHRAAVFSAIGMTEAGSRGEGLFARPAGRGPVLRPRRVPAHRLLATARSWIVEQEEPFLCWVHLGDPHDPLDVPKADRVFEPVASYRLSRRWAFTNRDDDVTGEAFRSYLEGRTNLYDAAVHATDAAIGTFWNSLDATERARTVLVVTADHGEELWEHREEELAFADPRGIAGAGHGHNLWQEIISIPFLIHGPGVAPAAVEEPVGLVDLMPTLLDLLEREVPPGLDGLSLCSPLPADRAVIAEGIAYGYQKTAVISGADKLVVAPGDGYEQTFRLDADLRESEASLGEGRLETLRSFVPGTWAGGSSDARTRLVDEDMTDHLRGLGYVE